MNASLALEAADLLTSEVRVLFHPIHLERVTLRAAPPLLMKVWGKGIQAITLGNHIFIDPAILSGHPRPLGLLVIHELTHLRQWTDGGYLGFYLPYLSEYLEGRRAGRSHRDAYMEISFETEAREMSARFR